MLFRVTHEGTRSRASRHCILRNDAADFIAEVDRAKGAEIDATCVLVVGVRPDAAKALHLLTAGVLARADAPHTEAAGTVEVATAPVRFRL